MAVDGADYDSDSGLIDGNSSPRAPKPKPLDQNFVPKPG